MVIFRQKSLSSLQNSEKSVKILWKIEGRSTDQTSATGLFRDFRKLGDASSALSKEGREAHFSWCSNVNSKEFSYLKISTEFVIEFTKAPLPYLQNLMFSPKRSVTTSIVKCCTLFVLLLIFLLYNWRLLLSVLLQVKSLNVSGHIVST